MRGISRTESVLKKIQGTFDIGLQMTYEGGISSNCLPLGEYNDTDFDFDYLLNYIFFPFLHMLHFFYYPKKEYSLFF